MTASSEKPSTEPLQNNKTTKVLRLEAHIGAETFTSDDYENCIIPAIVKYTLNADERVRYQPIIMSRDEQDHHEFWKDIKRMIGRREDELQGKVTVVFVSGKTPYEKCHRLWSNIGADDFDHNYNVYGKLRMKFVEG